MFQTLSYRFCEICGSDKTYIRKNGYAMWYKNDNGFLCSKCRRRVYNKNNPTEYNHTLSQRFKKYRDEIRQNLLDILGNRCVKCGFSDTRALQFDHINGGGTIERKKKFRNTTTMSAYYIKHPEEARKNLQVLCANCNWIKRFENNEHRECVKITIQS